MTHLCSYDGASAQQSLNGSFLPAQVRVNCSKLRFADLDFFSLHLFCQMTFVRVSVGNSGDEYPSVLGNSILKKVPGA